LKKCAEFTQNSGKWCAEFASYAWNFHFFMAQNSDNPNFPVIIC